MRAVTVELERHLDAYVTRESLEESQRNIGLCAPGLRNGLYALLGSPIESPDRVRLRVRSGRARHYAPVLVDREGEGFWLRPARMSFRYASISGFRMRQALGPRTYAALLRVLADGEVTDTMGRRQIWMRLLKT